jgi:peptide/nickel transport system substrate-binding protein
MNQKLRLLGYSLLFLAGCNSQVDNPSQLRIQINRFPESFSPIKTNEFDGIIFQFLSERDSTDKIVSNLAELSEKIAINDTISLFGFTLKSSAEWAHGVPVSKEDVFFTLKLNKCRLRSGISSGNFHLDAIKVFRPDSTNPQFFQLETHGNPEYTRSVAGDFLVMPEHIFDPQKSLRAYSLEEISTFNEENAPDDVKKYFDAFNGIAPYDSVYFKGSGPYQIESYYPDQSISLVLTGTDKEKLPSQLQLADKINYVMITDPTAARFALQNNEVDIITQVPATEFVQLEAFNKTSNSLNLYRQAGFKFVFFGFNTRQSKFSSKDVRIALSHIIDVQGIIDAVRLGYAEPTVGPVNPVLSDLYNDDISAYNYNPDQSRALLEKSGWNFNGDNWKNDAGETLDFELTYNGTNPDYQKIALIVQSEAKKIGVQVNLAPEESGTLLKRLRSHQFDAVLYSFVGSPRAYDYSPLFHTASAAPGKMNFSGFGTDESDQEIEKAILSTSREEMAIHLKKLQQILHEERPIVFLYFEQSLIATSKKFPCLNISFYRPGYDPVGFYQTR